MVTGVGGALQALTVMLFRVRMKLPDTENSEELRALNNRWASRSLAPWTGTAEPCRGKAISTRSYSESRCKLLRADTTRSQDRRPHTEEDEWEHRGSTERSRPWRQHARDKNTRVTDVRIDERKRAREEMQTRQKRETSRAQMHALSCTHQLVSSPHCT